MIDQAERLIVLADSTELWPRTGPVLCPLSAVDTVITDTQAPPAAVAMLHRSGVRLVQVMPAIRRGQDSDGRQ